MLFYKCIGKDKEFIPRLWLLQFSREWVMCFRVTYSDLKSRDKSVGLKDWSLPSTQNQRKGSRHPFLCLFRMLIQIRSNLKDSLAGKRNSSQTDGATHGLVTLNHYSASCPRSHDRQLPVSVGAPPPLCRTWLFSRLSFPKHGDTISANVLYSLVTLCCCPLPQLLSAITVGACYHNLQEKGILPSPLAYKAEFMKLVQAY